MAVKRINLWSGPRNVSTALMYAFAQRSDTTVVDEPFYAHYLSTINITHPGGKEVLDSQSQNTDDVISQLLSIRKSDVLFVKNMAHHMVDMEEQIEVLLKKFTNVFLIRDPYEMLLSFSKNISNPTMRDTAYQWQMDLFERVQSHQKPLLVLDARELLTNPRVVLSKLFEHIDLKFKDEMLSWEAGPISEDGIWAEYWYDSVHKSTGFKLYEPKTEPLPGRLKPLYEQCKSIYNRLNQYSIKA